MVNGRRAILLLVVTLAACAAPAPPPILTPVQVKVPVATPVYCQIPRLDQPALPIAALTPDSGPDDTVRAYAATVALLKGAVQQRDLLIAGCAAPAGGASAASSRAGATGEDKK